jgi:hypothetical protein
LHQLAYQLLIVVAGDTGSIGSGNPFKGPVVYSIYYCSGIKKQNRQRENHSCGYITNKTHAGRGFEVWRYSLSYRQNNITEY